MKSIFLAAIFFIFTFSCIAQETSISGVRLQLFTQEKIKPREDVTNTGISSGLYNFPIDTFPADRRLTFQLMNDSNQPIKVYGWLYDDVLTTVGYTLSFDKQNSRWIYPDTKDTKPWEGKKQYVLRLDFKILPPNKYLDFVNLVSSEGQSGLLFKKTVYVGSANSNEPVEIASEEFSIEQ